MMLLCDDGCSKTMITSRWHNQFQCNCRCRWLQDNAKNWDVGRLNEALLSQNNKFHKHLNNEIMAETKWKTWLSAVKNFKHWQKYNVKCSHFFEELVNIKILFHLLSDRMIRKLTYLLIVNDSPSSNWTVWMDSIIAETTSVLYQGKSVMFKQLCFCK